MLKYRKKFTGTYHVYTQGGEKIKKEKTNIIVEPKALSLCSESKKLYIYVYLRYDAIGTTHVWNQEGIISGN